MKYKVGDKFILEIQGVRNEEYHEYPYETEIDYNSEGELDKLPMLVNGVDTYSYNKGAEDAWELAKMINANYDKGGLKLTELQEVFGTHNINNIFVENTYQEAKAKLDAWEKAKEEIKVGDLVYVTNSKRGNGIVSRIDRDWCTVIWVDGSSGKWHINELAKTGESHADEVAALTGLLK